MSSRNKGMWIRARRKAWRYIEKRRDTRKLDDSKVKWVIAQKHKGTKTRVIAESVKVSERWIKKLWARYKQTDKDSIVYPQKMGRPQNGLYGRKKHSVTIQARNDEHLGLRKYKMP